MGTIKPFILQICGYKNTGKTTLVNKLVKFFSKYDLKVGTIKHDGHDFETINYLEDNFQHFNSGAQKSIVFSRNKWLLIEKKENTLEAMMDLMKDMDIIIVEGCKNSSLPKIELLRKGVSEYPISNPKNRIGVYSNFDYSKERCFKKDNDEIFHFLLKLIGKREKNKKGLLHT